MVFPANGEMMDVIPNQAGTFWWVLWPGVNASSIRDVANGKCTKVVYLWYTPRQNLKTIWKNAINHILRRNIVNTLLEDVWKTKTKHTTKWQHHTKNIYCIKSLKLEKPILQPVKSLRPLSKKWHKWCTKSHKDLYTIIWVSTVTILVNSVKNMVLVYLMQVFLEGQ